MAKKSEIPENVQEAVITEKETGDAADLCANDKAEDDGYVLYTLPFLPGVEPGEYQTVVINGTNYQVKYGEPIRMPKGVAEVLEQMVKASRRTNAKIKEMQQRRCITTLE